MFSDAKEWQLVLTVVAVISASQSGESDDTED